MCDIVCAHGFTIVGPKIMECKFNMTVINELDWSEGPMCNGEYIGNSFSLWQ